MIKNKSWIRGSFGRKKIYFKYLKSRKPSDIILIFCHGVFSSSYSNKNYITLAEKITSRSLADVVLYESSRNIQSWKNLGSWEEYIASFVGKTFENELDDLRAVIKKITKDNDKKIFLVGSSLGGTLASFLLPDYGKRIVGIFLLGSGVSTKEKNKPILSTYPEMETILENYKNYSGQVVLVQGTNDIIVPREDAWKVITNDSPSFLKELIILKGVDHTFSFVNDKNSKKRLQKIIFDLIKHKLTTLKLSKILLW